MARIELHGERAHMQDDTKLARERAQTAQGGTCLLGVDRGKQKLRARAP